MRDDSEASLNVLMGRLSAGDRSAFEPLFHALYPRAVRFARARLPNDSADDVAQAAMLRVFASAHRFVAGLPALPWFYAIVANEIRAALRSNGRYAELQEPELRRGDEDVEGALLQRELLRALEQAIETLDEPSAEAIRAQLGHGDRPALESATFRKRVSRAYARLRLLLGEYR